MSFWEILVIAIVEGLTEFLPVSSTGHMIITQALLGVPADEFTKLFVVNIQFGAILSVLVLYWKRFLKGISLYVKLLIAFIPAAVFGFLFGDMIDSLLENIWVVAISLILGGIVFLFIDRLFREPKADVPEPGYRQSLVIGLFQCIAMIPGVSRSAATIIGGMTQKLSRRSAAEFSFFLAVPTMLAATGYKLLKSYDMIQPEHVRQLLIGNVVAFVVAILAMKSFVSILTKYGFRFFGYYRIAAGLLILGLLLAGHDLKIVG